MSSLTPGETLTWSTKGFVRMIAVAQGVPGATGTFLAHFRGAWSSATTYAAGDIVTRAGSSWLALTPSTNVTPVEGASWTAVALGGTGQVNTVNTIAPVAGDVTLTAANVGAVATTAVGANSGVASLDSSGQIPTTQIPAIALNNVYTASSQTAMLALAAHGGDACARTDGAGTFMLKTGGNPATLADWVLLNAPTDAVVSVNGQTGTVVLNAANVSAVPTTRTVNTKPLSADITLTAPDVGAVTNTLGGSEKVAALSATTGTATGNCLNASWFTVTPTGNITLALTNPPASGTACTITVEISQGATPYTVTLPTGGIWIGTAPTQAASKKCIITAATRDGGTTWICSGSVQA